MQDGMKISGQLLKKSANCQIASYACGIVGAGVAMAGIRKNKVSERNPYLFTGGGIGIIGLILQVKSIEYKFKAGQALEVSAGKAVLKF